jgi:hypothetical protein
LGLVATARARSLTSEWLHFVLAQVPTVVEAMSGIDLGQLMGRVRDGAVSPPEAQPQPALATEAASNGHGASSAV